MLVEAGLLALLVAPLAGPGCTSHPDHAADCSDVAIDRFKELMIVDSAVTDDPRASNSNDGPWSFRHIVEAMTPPGTDPGVFIQNWFTEWVTQPTLNGYPLDDSDDPRAVGMNQYVLCPWKQATASNGCSDVLCTACTATTPKLDLAYAPFKLIGIANRMDERQQPGEGEAGTLRMLYALVDSDGMPLPFTLNFEYILPSTKSVQQWAEAWHQLGGYTDFGANYLASLQALTDSVVSANAVPQNTNGSALNDVRSNENALNWKWQSREFQLGSDGNLHIHSLRNTPDGSLNGSGEVEQFMSMNATAIANNTYTVPDGLLAGAIYEVEVYWQFPSVTDSTATNFILGTCNGCHVQMPNLPGSSGAAPIDTAFHVSPFAPGIAKVSYYLNSPTDPTHDELARRATVLQQALCGGG